MVILVILAYLVIEFFEVTPLIKERKKKEIYLYSSLLIFSLIISVLSTLGIDVPSPAKGIETIVNAVIGK